MEEIGCPTEPTQPEPSAGWEYRVLTLEELVKVAAGSDVDSRNAAIEQALNRFGADGWELTLQLNGGPLIFKRLVQ